MTDDIKGLLFDKDGTLFDFQVTWGAWAQQFFLEIADGDVALASRAAAQVGYDFVTCKFAKDSPVIADTPDEIAAALVGAVPNWDKDSLTAHVNTVAMAVPQAEPVPLAPLMAGFRSKGLKLGVATNDAQVPARAHLNSAGILELFDFIAGSDSGFGGKPAPDMQFGFCQSVGLRPDQVMMVGDSTHDLISGRAAGMGTIAVLTGVAEADELQPYADVVLRHIGEIPEFLGH
jgi:phosphoglycolate phosphatase